LQDVGVGAALDVAHILQGVAEVIDAALAEKYVEIEVGGQPFPQPQRVFKQRGRLAPKIIRADDGGVARGVAAAKPAAFEDGNAAGAVFFRQIVGGGKAVSAAPGAVLLYTVVFGRYVNGARSWIGIGDFGVQPSEFGKIVFIVFLAKYPSQKASNICGNL